MHGVATVSRIDLNICLFCRILSLLLGSFAKETYNLIDPTNQSHPITALLGSSKTIVHSVLHCVVCFMYISMCMYIYMFIDIQTCMYVCMSVYVNMY